MSKRITFELSQDEYDAVCKMWEQAKKSPIAPSKALNFDDFCKEIVVTCSKGPNLSDLLKGVDLNDLMGSMGDLSQLRDIFSDKKSADAKKTQEKKDDVPDDKKYKS